MLPMPQVHKAEYSAINGVICSVLDYLLGHKQYHLEHRAQ